MCPCATYIWGVWMALWRVVRHLWRSWTVTPSPRWRRSLLMPSTAPTRTHRDHVGRTLTWSGVQEPQVRLMMSSVFTCIVQIILIKICVRHFAFLSSGSPFTSPVWSLHLLRWVCCYGWQNVLILLVSSSFLHVTRYILFTFWNSIFNSQPHSASHFFLNRKILFLLSSWGKSTLFRTM